MKEKACLIECIVTTTTRPAGAGVGQDRLQLCFERCVPGNAQADEFLEHAQVYGNWYGLPKSAVRRALAFRRYHREGGHAGRRDYQEKVPQAVFIFLIPPTTKRTR